MTPFRKALNRLRVEPSSPRFSISDQLRFLADPPRPDPLDIRMDSPPTGSLPDGRTETTVNGTHYVITEAYPATHFHGKVRLDRLSLDDLSVLLQLARCSHKALNRERIVFLDTETTGVQGGTGTCPFLIGLGFFRGGQFQVVQYFIRDFDEEPSMLLALGKFLEPFDLIVTYNGKTFDLPLVENRCVLSRLEGPFQHLAHFDLLFTARRLWRASQGSCRLTALEEKIVGFGRGPDIPGSMIPRAYFDYIRSSDASVLTSVFSHNVYDICSLAALMVRAADQVVREPVLFDDALDLYSLGRIFDTPRDLSKSMRCYEMALESPLPAEVRGRILERLSVLYRRTGEHTRSLERCEELIARSEFSFVGYEGASLYHEYRDGDLKAASKLLEEALERTEGMSSMKCRRDRIQFRRDRIERKLQQSFRTANARKLFTTPPQRRKGLMAD